MNNIWCFPLARRLQSIAFIRESTFPRTAIGIVLTSAVQNGSQYRALTSSTDKSISIHLRPTLDGISEKAFDMPAGVTSCQMLLHVRTVGFDKEDWFLSLFLLDAE